MRVDTKVTSSLAILAAAMWLGGMLTLGAVAAPVVFHVVPAPYNADAMTVVFRRFDVIAMTCAALVLLSEAVRGAAARSFSRLDAARLAAAVLAGAAAIVQGVWLSPAIEGLHRAGAMRGVGPLGQELDSLHNLATKSGSAQALLLAVLLVLHVVTVSRAAGGQRV